MVQQKPYFDLIGDIILFKKNYLRAFNSLKKGSYEKG